MKGVEEDVTTSPVRRWMGVKTIEHLENQYCSAL